MNTRTCIDVARSAVGRVGVAVLLLSFATQAAFAAAARQVPAEFQGTWVPSTAACDSPLRVQVAADRLTLTNGKDSHVLGGLEMAGPGYFPPDYRGISAVLFTEFSGHQPVIATFNPDEKKGAARLEMARVVARAGNPQLKAYNSHIAKLNLAKRFPLDKVLLKKCSS
ncbi:MAG: hypothetical protein EHM59_07025 [Betaproteobacteria bacterium]|nr:MAG: hypothetical protein EHM59_07025 [Betaproteobacteria bacterium]